MPTSPVTGASWIADGMSIATPVLVTGASGFVGRRVVRALEKAEVAVIAVGGRADATTLGCNLQDGDAVRALIGHHAPRTVIHLAAMASVGQSQGDAARTWGVNVAGTFHLASACAALPHPVRFVFTASAEAYGASFLEGPCDETTPLRPLSVYARTKAAAEWMLRDMASDVFQVLIARPFNHIGVGQDARFVVPSFARQIAQAGADGVVKVGNLDAMRDFSDVDDLVDALLRMAEAPFNAAAGIFNIGSGDVRSVRWMLDRLVALSNQAITIELDPSRLRPSDVPVARGVFDAFDRQFGPRQRRPIDVVLRQILSDCGVTPPDTAP